MELVQGYGMTESVACISICSEENRLGSVGQTAGYIEVMVCTLMRGLEH